MRKEEKKEGLIGNLIEKKKRGELTSKDIKQEIYRRGLQHGSCISLVLFLSLIGYVIL